MSKIGDMTEKQLIELIDRRIREQNKRAELLKLFSNDEPDHRTWEEVKASIEQDRWTPPPGGMTSLEILRKMRDGGE